MKQQTSLLSHALLKCSFARPESSFDDISPSEHSYESASVINHGQASDLLLQQDARGCLYVGFWSDHQRVSCHDVRNPARSAFVTCLAANVAVTVMSPYQCGGE